MTLPCTGGPLYQDPTCLIDGFGLILLASIVLYIGIVVPGIALAYQRCARHRFGVSYSTKDWYQMRETLQLLETSIIDIPEDVFGHYKINEEEQKVYNKDESEKAEDPVEGSEAEKGEIYVTVTGERMTCNMKISSRGL